MPEIPEDVFTRWYSSLPAEKQFSPTTVPDHLVPTYKGWKKDTGLYEKSPDYDLKGWFMRQIHEGGGRGTATQMVRNPDGTVTPHTGSVGLNGKQLKSPNYPTFHMSALSEMVRNAGIDENEIDWDSIKNEKDSRAQLQTLLSKHDKTLMDAYKPIDEQDYFTQRLRQNQNIANTLYEAK